MDIIKLCFLVIILASVDVLSGPVSSPGPLKSSVGSPSLLERRAVPEGATSPVARSADPAEGDLQADGTFIGLGIGYGGFGGWGGYGGYGGYGYPYGGWGGYGYGYPYGGYGFYG